MNNKMYDPQAESLKVFWDSQQERLKLLSGMPITNQILDLTASFGEAEVRAFEKLMQTQKQLSGMLTHTPAAPAAQCVRQGVYNPVIDDLDLSDPRTVRRFEIRSVERSDVQRGENLTPAFGTMLMLGIIISAARKDNSPPAAPDTSKDS